MSQYLPCVVIPNYNHSIGFDLFVDKIVQFNLPVIIIDDGSDSATKEVLEKIENHHACVEVIHTLNNSGKGHAVKKGVQHAASSGYSHALQIDADGQHNTDDIEKFLALSKQFPESVITGIPVYDDTVPLGRFLSRYITHILVWLETLSFQIRDSMCGFRIYPVSTIDQVLENKKLGNRMEFDTEILVRLDWQGVSIVSVPTAVTYPDTGVSHFRLFKDNQLMALMHIKLVFGMLLRSPFLIVRKFQRKRPEHWASIPEKGSYPGVNLLLQIYRLCGRWIFLLILHPVIFYYLLFSRSDRRASREYLQRIYKSQGSKRSVTWLDVYKHFYAFGVSALDKVAAWSGDIQKQDVTVHGEDLFEEFIQSGRGGLFIGSHLGNLELCRALVDMDNRFRVNAVVFNKNAMKFQQVMQKNNKRVDLNLIHVEAIGMNTAIMLRQKIDDGEAVVIVGDRTSFESIDREQIVEFLGDPAPFSEGPFIMAGLLECPVYLLFCLKEPDGYHVYLEKFADSLRFSRRVRNEMLKQTIQRYADRLAFYCMKAPSQWFNFFDFWFAEKSQVKSDRTKEASERVV